MGFRVGLGDIKTARSRSGRKGSNTATMGSYNGEIKMPEKDEIAILVTGTNT